MCRAVILTLFCALLGAFSNPAVAHDCNDLSKKWTEQINQKYGDAEAILAPLFPSSVHVRVGGSSIDLLNLKEKFASQRVAAVSNLQAIASNCLQSQVDASALTEAAEVYLNFAYAQLLPDGWDVTGLVKAARSQHLELSAQREAEFEKKRLALGRLNPLSVAEQSRLAERILVEERLRAQVELERIARTEAMQLASERLESFSYCGLYCDARHSFGRDTIRFLYQTNRQVDNKLRPSPFNGERRLGKDLSRGFVDAKVSIDRTFGAALSLNDRSISTKVFRGDEWERALKAAPKSSVLVYVHGYKNSFDDGVNRMAQLIADLKFKGIAILFSWPSRAAVIDYLYDFQSALSSHSVFEALLRDLKNSGFEKIDVVAHSMGNLVVLHALKDVAISSQPFKISEFIMAAPDIDKSVMEVWSNNIHSVVDGITVYASATDVPLQISQKLAGGVPKVGQILGGRPLHFKGIDMLDASGVTPGLVARTISAARGDSSWLSHDVFATNPLVLSDIYNLLTSRTRPPHERSGPVRPMPPQRMPPEWWRFN